MSPFGSELFALLAAGHLLADFAFQSRAMVERKREDLRWLGFVLAAKSVARFKELENREFAEAYLVGTLTSFLVAGASGLLRRALVGS